MQSEWDPHFFKRSFLFNPLASLEAVSLWASRTQWPHLEDYNALSVLQNGKIVSGGGFSISCVKDVRPRNAKNASVGVMELYQTRIFFKGEVPTRERNWHDFFNFLVWLSFPMSKSALNMRHFIAYEQNADFPWNNKLNFRNAEQDFLTLLDEGGLVLTSSLAFPALPPDQQERREKLLEFIKEAGHKIEIFLFGHALHESLINNVKGIYAGALLLQVPAHFHELSYVERVKQADEELAFRLTQTYSTSKTSDLVALPLDTLAQLVKQENPFI